MGMGPGPLLQRLATRPVRNTATLFFRPKMTWGNITKHPATAGNKGAIVANHAYLHMNVYTVFLSARLQAGSQAEDSEEDAKDKGKIDDKGTRDFFGQDTSSRISARAQRNWPMVSSTAMSKRSRPMLTTSFPGSKLHTVPRPR